MSFFSFSSAHSINICIFKLSSKDEEFLVEKNKMANFQKENEKLRSKLTDRDNYISKLPTEEEVKETDRKVIILFVLKIKILTKLFFIWCRWPVFSMKMRS